MVEVRSENEGEEGEVDGIWEEHVRGCGAGESFPSFSSR